MFNDDRTISANDFLFGCNCLCSGDTAGDEEECLETYNSILDRSHYKKPDRLYRDSYDIKGIKEPLGLYLDSDGVKRLLNRIYGRENAMSMRKGYIDRTFYEKYGKCMANELEDHGTPRHSGRYPWSSSDNRSVCTIVPDRIIFNPPATIVFWKDGSKTVVKCAEGEKFDPYTGFCYAFTKHCLGNLSRIKKICRASSTGLPEASKAIVEGAKDNEPMSSFEKQSVAYMRRAICDKFSDGWSIDQIAKRFKMSNKDICEALGKEFE